VGADLAASAPLRAALDRARDTGTSVLSRQGDADAFALYLPVYRPGAPVATTAQRRAAFLGWVSGQFQAGEFLHQALRELQPFLSLDLYDQAVGPANLLARSSRAGTVNPGEVRMESLEFGGRTLVLRFAQLPGSPT
jgi:hypothetical protein